MAGELDSILITTDCPKCGHIARATYGHVRLNPTIGCKCGAVIKVDIPETGIDKVQKLITETNPPHAVND